MQSQSAGSTSRKKWEREREDVVQVLWGTNSQFDITDAIRGNTCSRIVNETKQWKTPRAWRGHMQKDAVMRKRQTKGQVNLYMHVPLMRLLIPSRLTNRLSMSSLPVKSSAMTYRLGLTSLAASNMN